MLWRVKSIEVATITHIHKYHCWRTLSKKSIIAHPDSDHCIRWEKWSWQDRPLRGLSFSLLLFLSLTLSLSLFLTHYDTYMYSRSATTEYHRFPTTTIPKVVLPCWRQLANRSPRTHSSSFFEPRLGSWMPLMIAHSHDHLPGSTRFPSHYYTIYLFTCRHWPSSSFCYSLLMLFSFELLAKWYSNQM